MSRWTMLCACAAAKPEAMPVRSSTASRTGTGPLAIFPVGGSAIVIGHHYEEMAILALFKPIDGADIRMVESRDRACFFEQALLIRFATVKSLREELESDDTVEFEIARLQDYAHVAGPDAPQNFVIAQKVSGCGRTRCLCVADRSSSERLSGQAHNGPKHGGICSKHTRK